MAVEAGETILTLLSLSELNADSVLILFLKKPEAVMTIPALDTIITETVEMSHACTVHLTSLFKGFDVMAVPAFVTKLAMAFIDEKDADSNFID